MSVNLEKLFIPPNHPYCQMCGVYVKEDFIIVVRDENYCMRCAPSLIREWCPGCDTHCC